MHRGIMAKALVFICNSFPQSYQSLPQESQPPLENVRQKDKLNKITFLLIHHNSCKTCPPLHLFSLVRCKESLDMGSSQLLN